jgi:hypothetical protein
VACIKNLGAQGKKVESGLQKETQTGSHKDLRATYLRASGAMNPFALYFYRQKFFD